MNNRSTGRTIVFAIAAAMLLLPFAASAAEETAAEKPKPAIELGAPFADNAILQRQMPVPVWGWSKPGTKVTVEFAGQKKTATASKDGKWMLQLDPLKANAEPQEMVITDSTGKIEAPLAAASFAGPTGSSIMPPQNGTSRPRV